MVSSKKLLAAIVMFALVCIAAQAQTPADIRTIRVSGEASMTVEADMAVLTLGVVQQGKTPLLVQQAVTASADKIISSLTALGIEKKKISTSNFSIYPVYDDRQGKQNEIIAYRATNSITVSLDDTSLVARSVEAAINAGANEIQGLQYKKRDEESLRLEVLKNAVRNAMDKAGAIAETLGQELGKAVTVEEQAYSMRTPDTRVFLAKAMAAAPAEAFAPGSIEVSASVTAVFEME